MAKTLLDKYNILIANKKIPLANIKILIAKGNILRDNAYYLLLKLILFTNLNSGLEAPKTDFTYFLAVSAVNINPV